SCGGCISSTMMVMTIARTPSLKASSRFVPIGTSIHRRMRFDCRRDREREGSPDSQFACHPNPPPVRLHDRADDREAEADARLPRRLLLPEGLKDVWQVIVRNAGPRIPDDELDAVLPC